TCKNIKPIPIGVDCPRCGAPLGARRSKRGRTFYGCSAYPKCDFTLWNRPIAEPCPACGARFLVEKRLKAGVKIQCASEGCAYQREATSPTPAEATAKS
ncbi:MAG: topoisomerase DNA-binding C4 zinc finger domain-containing protein, partial [candidate division NC10 bacterium]|nr:topoisomerase DNA-binding C4 zinc finger domain-containing protein [candidate division NC10 bacterium]